MRMVVVLVALAAVVPAAANENDAVMETLGALSIAPQICHIDIDRDALAAIGRRLLPGAHELAVERFRVNNRIAAASRRWTEAERSAYCAALARAAERLGLQRPAKQPPDGFAR